MKLLKLRRFFCGSVYIGKIIKAAVCNALRYPTLQESVNT